MTAARIEPRFTDQIVLIIGGNSGIGLASAIAFAREGARVIITGRDPATLESARKEIGEGTLAIRSEVQDLAAQSAVIDQVRQKYGRIDVLFVNAGIGKFVPVEGVSEELW